MKIIVNYKEEIIDKSLMSVEELLKLKEVKMPHMVSVQLNGKIVKKSNYQITFLKESDKVNFLYFMGGGKYWQEYIFKMSTRRFY